MADPIKSVLLVDYESLQRSVAGTADDMRLAEKAGAWLSALETGGLGPNVRRTFRVKRCYVTGAIRGKPRELLNATGFDLVDVSDAGTRRSADLHMAMDTMDALSKPEVYQEFILLSAAADLAPLITRLKNQKRVTVIYADAATPTADRSLADAVIEMADFAHVINGGQASAAQAGGASSAPTGGRGDIEAFARRIHAATSVPLFSPKTFAELFRHLTEEIAANGYHFQTTARNVADRMVANGRNVTRRQVVFIVKGLALKGHVFSTTDTADKLAEVFREQARYLINSAGIALTAHEEDLLSAWFLSRPPSSAPAASAPVIAGPPPAAPAPAPSLPEPSADAKATIAETIEREVAKAVTASRPNQPQGEKIKPPRPQAPPPPPAAAQKPPQVKAVEMPKSSANKPQPLPSAREEAKAVIAARIAGAARMKPAGTRTPIPAKPAPKAPSPPPQAAPEPPEEEGAPPPAAGGNAEALESSILAAIAEAVDVLVEDSAAEAPPPPAPPAPAPPERSQREAPSNRKRGNNNAAPPRQPEPPAPPAAEEDEGESNDIGDQIQRIIASYNRNRSDE
ncbi:MAG TPA: NYN domain-containing protein [Bauldia sp.]|nr:NYN domain-containing protein [Bauldia sp.]